MTETTETEMIEHDLARTRARLDNRLEELQERLAPGQIVNDALTHFTGGDGADFAQDLVGKLKANPLPALLAGVGIAWLMVSSSRTAPAVRSTHTGTDMAARLSAAETNVRRLPDEHPDDHASRVDDARGEVLGVVRDASDTAADYARRIKDAASAAIGSARETMHDFKAGAAGAATDFGGTTQRSAAAVQEGMKTMVQSTRNGFTSLTSSPLALGAIAAVVGLVAGTLIPTSDEEEHALGGTAGRLRQAGSDLAQDIVDRGGQVASEALGVVKDSAGAHGLSVDKPVTDRGRAGSTQG